MKNSVDLKQNQEMTTSQNNFSISQMRDRCKSNEAFFSSFIDLVPARVYLNPDDRQNWIKIVSNESKKKKISKKEDSNQLNGKFKKLKQTNGREHSEDDEDEDEEENDEQFDPEFRYNRFDPKFFKTVSEILKDFESYHQKDKKNIQLKLTLNRARLNKASALNQAKSTAVKVLNKSQNKSSKSDNNNAKENSDKQIESNETTDDNEEITNNNNEPKTNNLDAYKKAQKRASKFKEEKRAAIKRQRLRYDSQSETQIVNIDHLGANSTENRKPILNKNGQIVYSKFDFTADKTLKNKKKDDKLTPSNAKPKDYKKLLKVLQEKREKVEELKQTEPEKASELELKSKWKSAIDKAAGIKVKDDVSLLKKAVKRMEKKKEKSKKNWDDRNKAVEEHKNKVQEKRMKNLEKRKEKNKEKKIKKLKKKGRILPGF